MSGFEKNPSPDLRAALERLRRAGRKPPSKKVTFDIEGADVETVAELVTALVHAADLTPEDRVEALASAFAVEAIRGHTTGDPMEAHKKLREEDDKLALAIETLAPWLLSRISTREDAEAAVAAVEELIRERSS